MPSQERNLLASVNVVQRDDASVAGGREEFAAGGEGDAAYGLDKTCFDVFRW